MNQPTTTDPAGTVTLPIALIADTVAALHLVEDWLIHTDPVALDEADQSPPIPVDVLADHLASTAYLLRHWRNP